MVGMQNELVRKTGTASHDLMTRLQGMMSKEVFEAVVKNLADFGIKKVYLHFQGEPFLNPLTISFAQMLKQKRFEVGIFTNGLVLSDALIKQLADCEIDLIRFSVDGASQETYGKNRVGGDFKRVYEIMRKTVSVHQGKPTRIEWQFLALKNNEHEIEKATAMAREIGIHFFVKGFRETDPALRPVNPKYQSVYLKKPCKDIYHQIGIYWNGDVVPCCYDTDGKEIMGNITRTALRDIWNDQRYKDFRSKVDRAARVPEGDPGICKTCLRWR